MTTRPVVKVFVTKTQKFRAKISKPGQTPFEVTIGGQSWSEGKGREYMEAIKRKVKRFMNALQQEAKELDKDVLE